MIDQSGTTTYSYDQRGNLTSEEKEIDGLTFVTGYDHDRNDNLIELRYPSTDPTTRQGAVDYHYDYSNRLDNVSVLYNGDPIDIASGFQYKPFGPRTAMTLGNSLMDTRTYDTRYQLGTWNLWIEGPTSKLRYIYGLNNDGNLESITDDLNSDNNRTFVYDEMHRVTTATGPWCIGPACTACTGSKTYTYDRNGNRTCTGESGTATNYEYSSTSNRLDTSANPSYSYDDNGNIKADGTHTYDYSEANRLAKADDWTTYDYDGEGRRVRKASTASTYFFYDPSGRILTELSINNEVYGGAAHGEDYVYLPDAPIARVDWSILPNPNYGSCTPRNGIVCPPPRYAIANLLYYHTDHLGTPLAMTDQSGELVWKAEYSPFGGLFSNEIAQVENNLRFPGQYFDSETGLHQNRFRDYDPKTGRYREADPIGLFGGTNPFNYVAANPVRFVDPFGLCGSGVNGDKSQKCGPEPFTGLSPGEMGAVQADVDYMALMKGTYGTIFAHSLALDLVTGDGPWNFKHSYVPGSPEREYARRLGNVNAGAVGTGGLGQTPYLNESLGGVYSIWKNGLWKNGQPNFVGIPFVRWPYGDLDYSSAFDVDNGARWGVWHRCMTSP